MGKRHYDRKRVDIVYAQNQGWEYCGKSGSGHLRFEHPEVEQTLFIGSTPSEYRSAKNNISYIRRITPPRKD